MLIKGEQGGTRLLSNGTVVPNKQLIIIPTTSEMGPFGVPLEPADLLLMCRNLAKSRVGLADIGMHDSLVKTPGGQDMLVPREGTHPGGVPLDASDRRLVLRVPDLDLNN